MSCGITYVSVISQALIDVYLPLNIATERLVFQMDLEVFWSVVWFQYV